MDKELNIANLEQAVEKMRQELARNPNPVPPLYPIKSSTLIVQIGFSDRWPWDVIKLH